MPTNVLGSAMNGGSGTPMDMTPGAGVNPMMASAAPGKRQKHKKSSKHKHSKRVKKGR